MEDRGDAATPADKAAPVPPVHVKAVEDGDTVHFERPGPFGLYRWDRKKSELSEEERGWLERSRTTPPDGAKKN
jgi:hypothetical protein